MFLVVDVLAIEDVPQDVDQVVRHLVLLLHAAVVLNGEDDGIVGALEGVFLTGLDNVFEHYLGCQSVAVVNDRLPVSSVPAVNWKYNLVLREVRCESYVLHSDSLA